MTYNDILKHCDYQVERLKQFADAPEDTYNRHEYDEHKMVADLIRESGKANKARPRVSYDGMVAWSNDGINWNPCRSELSAKEEAHHDDPSKTMCLLADVRDVPITGSANVDYIIENIANTSDVDLDDVTDEQYKVLQERLDNVIANWINEFRIGEGIFAVSNIREAYLSFV